MLYRYRCIVTVQHYYQILTFLRGWDVGKFMEEEWGVDFHYGMCSDSLFTILLSKSIHMP